MQNPSDMIKLNENSRTGLNFGDTLTSATGHGISIDQTSDAAMLAQLNNSPRAGGNTSFDFDNLQESSMMTAERQSHLNQQKAALNYNSGGLKVSLLNSKSPTLPNILPAMQSDAKLMSKSRMFDGQRSPATKLGPQ